MEQLQEKQSAQNDLFDELTGIYNRAGFYSATEQLLKNYPEQQFCLIYWNIRKFRVTNDLFGRDISNKILIHWANNLRKILCDELAVYGRLEHDNFVCCVPERFLDNDDWKNLGEINYSSEGITYNFYSCCGLYQITDRNLPISNMLDRARAAMETIKDDYTSVYAWYDDNIWNTILEEQRINSEFKNAIAEKQFKVYYQPICRASDGLVISAEALVRWIHPVKGMISPGTFIPLFEKNGFISILDRYVWNEVCAAQQSRLDQGLATVPVSINVSRVEFYNPNLCDDLLNIVKKHNISPELLKIEITESAYATSPVQVLTAVEKLRSYGFSVLMDDFGSGYSSLNMLKNFPIDILKIDMRFLDNLSNNPKTAIVLESIIRLAKWMNLSVVSEGVETQSEWEYLRSIECDSIQGYYFYKPMPLEDFTALLDEAAANSVSLLFHSLPEVNNSILDVFNLSNTRESILFYNMLDGMGLLTLSGDNVEIIRANKGFYETIFNSVKKEIKIVNKPFHEPLRGIVIKQCLTAKETNEIQKFHLDYKHKDGRSFRFYIKLRYMGGSPQQEFYLFSIHNSEEQKEAGTEQASPAYGGTL